MAIRGSPFRSDGTYQGFQQLRVGGWSSGANPTTVLLRCDFFYYVCAPSAVEKCPGQSGGRFFESDQALSALFVGRLLFPLFTSHLSVLRCL